MVYLMTEYAFLYLLQTCLFTSPHKFFFRHAEIETVVECSALGSKLLLLLRVAALLKRLLFRSCW